MTTDESYSVKEMISEFRRDVNQRFDKVDDAQAHTNGDVTALKVWRGYLTGGLAVITAIVIPLLVYVWDQGAVTRSQLQTISSSRQSYETTSSK